VAAIGTRSLTVLLDTVEVAPAVSSVTIDASASDSDFVSFADAAAGGSRQYVLKFTAVQDPVANSLWDKIWVKAGTDVAVLVRPFGNATATPTQPHFSGTVNIREPDGTLLGGDADPSTTARFTVECEWPFAAKPTRVTA
jgi:hypothetical protein